MLSLKFAQFRRYLLLTVAVLAVLSLSLLPSRLRLEIDGLSLGKVGSELTWAVAGSSDVLQGLDSFLARLSSESSRLEL